MSPLLLWQGRGFLRVKGAIMIGGPILVTERLILRPPQAQDLDGWAKFQADAETMRYIGGPQPRSMAWRSLCTMAGAWQIRGFAMFSVIERASGAWVGRVGPWYPEGWPQPEIGWGVLRDHAGTGYAHEAAAACMDYAFDVLGWSEVIHCIDPENTRSIALAKRLGSTNLRRVTMPAPFHETRVDAWGQSAEQWRARQK